MCLVPKRSFEPTRVGKLPLKDYITIGIIQLEIYAMIKLSTYMAYINYPGQLLGSFLKANIDFMTRYDFVNVTTLESVNPIMFERMPLDPSKDLQHVALLANTQLFLVTRPTLAPNTLAEFVAYARANPGKLSYGSAGNGTTPHVGGELFKQTAGIFATHIPYRGAAPAIQDVMAGQIDYAFVPGTVFPSVKAGKLKLLAVASRQRASYYASAPTVEEAGFGKVYVDTPFAVYAPAAMPAAHVARVNRELNRLLALPATRARFADVGAEPVVLSPAELTALVQEETALFGPIVKARGIKID